LPESDLKLLIDAAQAAGKIALGHRGQALETWEKPGGAGPVTEADLEIDRMLQGELCAARPDYGWLSEETADNAARLGARRVFIVDPIDGTRAFIAGASSFAHSLAIAEAGEIIAAVVYLPALEKLYVAARGHGATRNGAAIRPSAKAALEGATVLAAKPSFDAKNWIGGTPPLIAKFRPALAYRLCLVAEGRFDAMLTLRPAWEWDIAAGTLIVTEAGGAASEKTGAPLRFNRKSRQSDGLVGAGVELHRRLVERLAGHRRGRHGPA